jgi:hypothetical protein
MSKYPKQSWRNRLIFVWSPVNGIGLFIPYSWLQPVFVSSGYSSWWVRRGLVWYQRLLGTDNLWRQMIDKGEVVPVLQGFVLRKKRQKALVRLVQWVFLWITNFFCFQICWVLPQCSLVHGGSKDWLWCLIWWCHFHRRKQQNLVALHFVTTLILNKYWQSSNSSV